MPNPEIFRPEGSVPGDTVGKHPWEEELIAGTAVFSEKYLKKDVLSPEEKVAIAKCLKSGEDEVRIKFVKRWCERNKELIKAAGFKYDSDNIEHMIGVTARLGGFKEMNRYRPESRISEEIPPTYKEQLDNLKALQYDLQQEVVPFDSQLLILNKLNEEAKSIEEEIEKAPRLSLERKTLKQQKRELFESRKNLAKNIEKIFSGKEMKGFRKKTWEAKIQELSGNLQSVIGQTEVAYQGVKDRIITQYTIGQLKREAKTRKQLELIEETFTQRGEDPFQFLKEGTTRQEELEDLTGEWETDKEFYKGFLRRYDLPFTSDHLDAAIKKEELAGIPYDEKLIRSQIGFWEWFLKLIFAADEVRFKE